MSEPSHTKGDGDHVVDMEATQDSASTAHGHQSAESTEVEDTEDLPKAKRAKHSHTNDSSVPNTGQDTRSSPAPKVYTSAEKQKMDSLIGKNKALASKQAEVSQKEAEVLESMKNRDPRLLVGRHIDLLHQYNEIRDSGQKLMAFIAEARGMTAKEVYEEFGVDEDD